MSADSYRRSRSRDRDKGRADPFSRKEKDGSWWERDSTYAGWAPGAAADSRAARTVDPFTDSVAAPAPAAPAPAAKPGGTFSLGALLAGKADVGAPAAPPPAAAPAPAPDPPRPSPQPGLQLLPQKQQTQPLAPTTGLASLTTVERVAAEAESARKRREGNNPFKNANAWKAQQMHGSAKPSLADYISIHDARKPKAEPDPSREFGSGKFGANGGAMVANSGGNFWLKNPEEEKAAKGKSAHFPEPIIPSLPTSAKRFAAPVRMTPPGLESWRAKTQRLDPAGAASAAPLSYLSSSSQPVQGPALPPPPTEEEINAQISAAAAAAAAAPPFKVPNPAFADHAATQFTCDECSKELPRPHFSEGQLMKLSELDRPQGSGSLFAKGPYRGTVVRLQRTSRPNWSGAKEHHYFGFVQCRSLPKDAFIHVKFVDALLGGTSGSQVINIDKQIDAGQKEFCKITFWVQFEKDGKISTTRVAKIELYCRRCEPKCQVGPAGKADGDKKMDVNLRLRPGVIHADDRDRK